MRLRFSHRSLEVRVCCEPVLPIAPSVEPLHKVFTEYCEIDRTCLYDSNNPFYYQAHMKRELPKVTT
jgi:hypothetical protein